MYQKIYRNTERNKSRRFLVLYNLRNDRMLRMDVVFAGPRLSHRTIPPRPWKGGSRHDGGGEGVSEELLQNFFRTISSSCSPLGSRLAFKNAPPCKSINGQPSGRLQVPLLSGNREKNGEKHFKMAALESLWAPKLHLSGQLRCLIRGKHAHIQRKAPGVAILNKHAHWLHLDCDWPLNFNHHKNSRK